MADTLSIEVAEISADQRDKLDVEKGGVMVMKVEQGPAISAGVRPGDVILSLNNEDVKDAHHFVELSKDLPKDKPVPILIQRNGQSQFLALKLDK